MDTGKPSSRPPTGSEVLCRKAVGAGLMLTLSVPVLPVLPLVPLLPLLLVLVDMCGPAAVGEDEGPEKEEGEEESPM